DDKHAKFISTVLADTERIWQEIFIKSYGQNYTPPQLVLYRGSTRSGCGQAQAQVGPFYCPADAKVYIDLGFLDNLVSSHGGGGDFAEAYVLAHEVGHHIQNLQGTLDKVQRYNANGTSEQEQNAIQVKVELQADCYSGLWAHHAQKKYAMLEAGDIDEALNTTAAIGDDVLQKEAQGYAVPDSFTHGSAAQRSEWFKRGFEIGTIEACDTFK
ncbi:MAG: neutral zinc metallopeptidase, partial [Campylobacterales bacterium]|nr:neutral zinc metallopeptidase [Campylobacterales bacterium]